MQFIRPFCDERQSTWCLHCTTSLSEVRTNKDHVPSKCFLKKPYPENLPTVEICAECNNGFSADENYFACVIHAVLAGSLSPDPQHHPEAAKILRHNQGIARRLNTQSEQVDLFPHELPFTVYPDYKRIERVLVKNAKGHAFYEYGEPMLESPSTVEVFPIHQLSADNRARFESSEAVGDLSAWPEVGSRMMDRVMTGREMLGEWIVVEDGIHRYAVDQAGGLRVRMVIRDYLGAQIQWFH